MLKSLKLSHVQKKSDYQKSIIINKMRYQIQGKYIE